VTAASTPPGAEFGLVFKNCRLTASDAAERVYLGRPWRRYARTVFINSELGAHIVAEGWDNWSDASNEKTVFYGEFGNTGPGANTAKRASWSSQLSNENAGKYTLGNILRGWQPME